MNHIEKDFSELFAKQKKKTNTYKELVNEYLVKHSSEQREYDARNHPVYYLTLPKSKIYKKMIEENPFVKLSISTFYRLCDKNFKKSTKKTDVCLVCKRAESLLKKIKSNLPENLIAEYLEEYKAYEQHYLVAQH